MPSLVPLIEAAAADLLHSYAISLRSLREESDAETLSIGLAAACFAGTGNPLTTVKGLGPQFTKAELEQIESFYAARDVAPVLELAPWITPASMNLLKDCGYQQVGEEDVMLRATGEAAPQGAEIVDDVSKWAKVLCMVFGGEVSPTWMEIGVSIGKIEGSQLVGLREDSELVAVAQIVPGLRVATLGCDGTIEAARGKGYQRRLIEARIGLAQALGLGWCVSEVAPGSASQRNYERCGFEKAYTRQHWKKS